MISFLSLYLLWRTAQSNPSRFSDSSLAHIWLQYDLCFIDQEQLHQSEHTIRELERKMEEKDRELHAIKLDNEAVCFFYIWTCRYFLLYISGSLGLFVSLVLFWQAWAKEDLLREQNKELATFRYFLFLWSRLVCNALYCLFVVVVVVSTIIISGVFFLLITLCFAAIDINL